VDDDILIDAGSGVTRLSLEQLVAIDHVFITHSHLDHILALPLLLDSVGGMRDHPVTVYALDAVIEILRQDIFNWRVWPDFTEVPPVWCSAATPSRIRRCGIGSTGLKICGP
jgi:cAMP phosphodiesterase